VDPSRTVLIVDDAAMFRELGALFLARCARVLTAETGRQAIEIIRVERPQVVLVDLYMPGLDGVDVCRAIRSDPQIQNTSVIVMLGDGDPSERARALRAGANEVIAKPLSRVALIDAVKRHLGTPVSQGQPRLDLSMPVNLRTGLRNIWGTGLNLSRGGIYVETDQSFALQTELDVRFILPDTGATLRSTAEVVWRGLEERSRDRFGIGVRFLEIDGSAVRQLDDYIFERVAIRTAMA
jgi:CheY-like chemotaxis protein/Tfp pilus assembly protein PilZ